MARPWGAPEWRRAFLATLIAAYGLALVCAFVLVPWVRGRIYEWWAPPAPWHPFLLDVLSWGREAGAILRWLIIPVNVWAFSGGLGALDRWVKVLTAVHLVLLLLALAWGAAIGGGFALVRSSGTYVGPLK